MKKTTQKKFSIKFSTDKAILMFTAGVFGAALILGGVLMYGVDKIL